MSRPLVRSATAILIGMTVVVSSLLGVQSASSLESITGVSSTPLPPKKAEISWDASSAPGVTTYKVTMNPGSRIKEVPSSMTSVVFTDLGWSVDYTATVEALDSNGSLLASGDQKFRGTKLLGDIDSSVLVRGQKTLVTGSLRWRNDEAIPNAKIVIQRAYNPVTQSGWQNVGTTTTTARGNFELKVTAYRNSEYQVLYRGQPATSPTVGGWDAGMNLAVRVPISLKFSDNPVRFGRVVRFSGALDAPDSLVVGSLLRLQHKVSGSWKTVKATEVRADGTYSLRYEPLSRLDQSWRVLTTAGVSFAASTSASKKLVVR